MDQELLLNRYRLQQRRGKGGFSVVDSAWDQRLRRRVAIKRIPLRVEAHDLPGIEEARTAALLSDAHIVSVYDFELTGTEALIIMENVDGPSLAELMRASQELFDLDVVSTILASVVAALECAHENQILHLDIKPANILIDHAGQVKVSDFGLAALSSTAGFKEPQGGTIGYMPPEQIAMESVDERSDLWALAALAYQLLTGDNPFFASSADESLERIVHEPLILPSILHPELDDGINDVLVRALDADKDTRPDSVKKFWKELSSYLGREKTGRQQLKTLVAQWDAGGMVNTTEPLFDDAHKLAPLKNRSPNKHMDIRADEYEQAGWDDNYEFSNEDDYEDEEELRLPLWEQLSTRTRGFLARLFAFVGTGTMSWLGCSGLVALSVPFEFTLVIRGIIVLAIALCGLIVPPLGVALSSVALGVGIIVAGQPLVGSAVLVILLLWWFFLGRRSSLDASIMSLAPLAAAIGLPFVITLLSGYFLKLKHAFGLALASILLLPLLSVVAPATRTVLGFSNFIRSDLLRCGFELHIEAFGSNPFEAFVTAFANTQTMLALLSWIAAAVVVALCAKNRSRVLCSLGVLLASLVLAGAVLVAPYMLGSVPDFQPLTERAASILIACIIMFIMIAIGVTAQPSEEFAE